MKLTRFYSGTIATPAVITSEDCVINVSSFGEDFDSVFFESDGPQRLASWLNEHKGNLDHLPLSEVTLASAICRPPNIICVGLNYAAHVKEFTRDDLKTDLPEEPVLFNKSTASWADPNGNVIIPKDSQKSDWETELAIVIGKRAKYVQESDAYDYIAGYALMNDYSERAWQKERGGQWMKGKSADTFSPFGPYLATPDEISDPHNLDIWLKLNGETMQSSNTSNFIFSIPYLISYTSQFMTLLPGDVISTGTPSGVGLGQTPPRFLQDGDIIEYGITGLGSQRQQAVREQI